MFKQKFKKFFKSLKSLLGIQQQKHEIYAL